MEYEMTGYVEPQGYLPLEYEMDYGTARRQVEIPNIFDNPVVFGPVGGLSLLGTEEVGDFILLDTRPLRDDVSHPVLIR